MRLGSVFLDDKLALDDLPGLLVGLDGLVLPRPVPATLVSTFGRSGNSLKSLYSSTKLPRMSLSLSDGFH